MQYFNLYSTKQKKTRGSNLHEWLNLSFPIGLLQLHQIVSRILVLKWHGINDKNLTIMCFLIGKTERTSNIVGSLETNIKETYNLCERLICIRLL